MMTSEEIEDKIDQATSAVTISHFIDWYAQLLRIKYAPNREEEIDRAIRFRETILEIWNVDVNELREAGKALYNDKVGEDNRLEDLSESDIEIPSNILPNMVEWMRKNGITDSEILDCILFMMKENKKDE